jgi:hypothetical protein
VAEEIADAAPGGLDRARVGFAQQGLELGEDLLDRIEIGRVARQVEQLGARRRGSSGARPCPYDC